MREQVFIPISTFAFVGLIVMLVLMMRHMARRREYEHQERMRALELGHVLQGSNFWPSLAVMTIGAGVPSAAFLTAWLANLLKSGQEDAWSAATAVGICAVIGGVFLASRLLAVGTLKAEAQSRVQTPEDYRVWTPAKATMDPDAYDTVGQRG